MSLKCGIVGLPNVGKSTLFNALTKAGIAAENYPFCTIEPNVGIVEVPDPRLGKPADIVKPPKVVPAVCEFVDIAWLVAGASNGDGLVNQPVPHLPDTYSRSPALPRLLATTLLHLPRPLAPFPHAQPQRDEVHARYERARQPRGQRLRSGAVGDRRCRIDLRRGRLRDSHPLARRRLGRDRRGRVGRRRFSIELPRTLLPFFASLRQETEEDR